MTGHALFLSSSSDLLSTREAFGLAFRAWIDSLGQSEFDIAPYLWEELDPDADFDKREPIQTQLRRTDDAGTLLTVGMFGERCGLPLADGYPLPYSFEAWRTGEFRLEHPWPADFDKIDQLLANGAYPLTGTVFELLCAVEAAGSDPQRQKPLIGYAAKPVIGHDTPWSKITFNGGTYQGRTLHNKSEEEQDGLRPMLRRQKQALRNFICALQASGRCEPIRYDDDNTMREGLLAETRRILEPRLRPDDSRRGYRPTLGAYTIRDSYPLPGLQEKADADAKAFHRRAFAKDSTAADRRLLVTGPSGCGKSSYMGRGLLGSLVRQSPDKVPVLGLIFRATDIAPRADGNSLPRLWRMILQGCPEVRTNFVFGDDPSSQAAAAAKALNEALKQADRRLVIGLDQFEELLDILFGHAGSAVAQKSLAPSFDFLRRCIEHEDRRVALVATLESQRQALRSKLAGPPFGWTFPHVIDLHLGEQEVRLIAQKPLTADGLRPAGDALNEIVERWRKIDAGSSGKASSLPLLGLWLARLQERHRWLARQSRDTEVPGSAEGKDLTTEFEGILQLHHVQDMPQMADLVDELADAAWIEGSEGYEATVGEGAWRRPKPSSVNTFLQPFVGISRDGALSLRAVRRVRGIGHDDRVVNRFIKARLMVPIVADGQDMVRLTHQAVIDRWGASREWHKTYGGYLKDELRLLQEAMVWDGKGRPKQPEGDVALAATVLALNRLATGNNADKADLDPDTALLIAYAKAVFGRSMTPLEPVRLSDPERLHIHIAAMYDLDGLLDGWLFGAKDTDAKQALLSARGGDGRTPLGQAAYSSPASVRVLLRHEAQPKEPGSGGHHPMTGAIYLGRTDIVAMLFDAYAADPDEAIAPGGWTMAHVAARNNQIEVLDWCLARNVSPDAEADGKVRPLQLAALNGHLAIVKRLRSRGRVFARDDGGWAASDLAAASGNWRSLDALLGTPDLPADERRALLNTPKVAGPTVLGLAAANLHPGTVRYLLGREEIDPADPVHLEGGTYGSLAHIAAARSYRAKPNFSDRLIETLEVLLEDARIDPNRTGSNGTPLEELVADTPSVLRYVVTHPRYSRHWDRITTDLARREIPVSPPAAVGKMFDKRPDLLTEPGVLGVVRKEAWEEVGSRLLSSASWTEVQAAAIVEAATKALPFAGSDRFLDGLVGRMLKDHPNGAAGVLLSHLASRSGQQGRLSLLIDGGAPLDHGIGDLALTPAHLLAQRADLDLLRRVAAAGAGRPAPRDAWGRTPDQVAPRPLRSRVAAIWAEHARN